MTKRDESALEFAAMIGAELGQIQRMIDPTNNPSKAPTLRIDPRSFVKAAPIPPPPQHPPQQIAPPVNSNQLELPLFNNTPESVEKVKEGVKTMANISEKMSEILVVLSEIRDILKKSNNNE